MSQKLYVMKNAFKLFKIGIAKDPSKRAKDVSNNSGVPVELIKCFECDDAFKVEQFMHRHFKDRRKCGEWFKFKTEKQAINEISEVFQNFEYYVARENEQRIRDKEDRANTLKLKRSPIKFKDITPIPEIYLNVCERTAIYHCENVMMHQGFNRDIYEANPQFKFLDYIIKRMAGRRIPKDSPLHHVIVMCWRLTFVRDYPFGQTDQWTDAVNYVLNGHTNGKMTEKLEKGYFAFNSWTPRKAYKDG